MNRPVGLQFFGHRREACSEALEVERTTGEVEMDSLIEMGVGDRLGFLRTQDVPTLLGDMGRDQADDPGPIRAGEQKHGRRSHRAARYTLPDYPDAAAAASPIPKKAAGQFRESVRLSAQTT